MENKPYINIEVSEKVGTITFYHPTHNSLPGSLLNELAESITAAGKNEAITVIVLKSAGDRTFCAGANFEELLAIHDMESGRQFFSGFAKVINACRTCPKFIIGRIQGKAVGGGVGLASAVDYCMATKFAGVKLSELNIGIGPFVVGPAVARKIGVSGMSQLAINADTFQSAQWAKEKGLYTDIFETTELLDAAVVELTDKLVKYNPSAMQLLKEKFWEGTEDWDELLAERADISGSLVIMEYTKEILRNSK